MTILLIALFAVMFVLYIINIRTNSQYEKLESLKANPLDVINNLCLTKTRKFIGTKKQYYCYYNFIITNEFLILERNPNAAILKELPILIIRNPNYTEITSYKNIFKIDTS